MNIKPLKLRDYNFKNEWESIESRWNYGDFLKNEPWRKEWISFDGVVYHGASDRIYCGITSFDADIFKAYDRKQKRFVDLDFSKVADRYDAKFHRSMQLDRKGEKLYLATALLHDIDDYWNAPGGGIFLHHLASGKTEKLGIPKPHNYIQSIVLDENRGVIYSMHFTPESLSRFDLDTCKSVDLGPLGSGMAMAQGENLVMDDDGCVWSGWGLTRAWQSTTGPDSYRLCKYDPHQGRIQYFSNGLPRADGAYGNAKVEGLFNFGTGCLYASGDNGSLFRIDPKTAASKYLGTPIKNRRSRLTSLVLHQDGYVYGITGRDGLCQLLRFDLKSDTFELGDPIIDPDGTSMWQCHDICVTSDGVLYAGENDHFQRSSYLWEIQIS